MIDGKCAVGRQTQLQAEGFCLAGAARLCTVNELLYKSAKGTGCDLDNTMVWTSDECEGGTWVVKGKGGLKHCATHGTVSLHGVRCCADMNGGSISRVFEDLDTLEPYDDDAPRIFGDDGDSAESHLSDPAAERGAEISTAAIVYKQCNEMEDHGEWKFFNDHSSCGGSMINGKCAEPRASTLLEAKGFCLTGGARLCTSEELFSQTTKGTGCLLDDEMVWSSTPCREGAWVVEGQGRSASCQVNTQSRFGARCCADGLKDASTIIARSRKNIDASQPEINGADTDWALSTGLFFVGLVSIVVVGVVVVTTNKAGTEANANNKDEHTQLADAQEPKAQLSKATPSKRGMRRATSFVGAI